VSDFSSQLYNRSCFYVNAKDIFTLFLSIYYNTPTWFVDGWIKIIHNIDMFKQASQRIIELISDVLKEMKGSNLKMIVLVGGFSGCKILPFYCFKFSEYIEIG
jgi:hypothetical protein